MTARDFNHVLLCDVLSELHIRVMKAGEDGISSVTALGKVSLSNVGDSLDQYGMFFFFLNRKLVLDLKFLDVSLKIKNT